MANDLSALYNTTTEVNSSAIENFDWASVFGQTPPNNSEKLKKAPSSPIAKGLSVFGQTPSNNSEKLKKAPSSPISKDPQFQPWDTILNSNFSPKFGSFGSNSSFTVS